MTGGNLNVTTKSGGNTFPPTCSGSPKAAGYKR
jgi:hypothetical protein